MKHKVRIEIDPSAEEEVIIRCHDITEEVLLLKQLAENGGASGINNILLTLNGTEYIVPLAEVLYFETYDDKTAVHTADNMYYTEKTLYRLTNELGGSFVRVSKSCIVNIERISSMKRELTGICEATFYNCSKTVFISRMYYKMFRERLTEVRIGN